MTRPTADAHRRATAGRGEPTQGSVFTGGGGIDLAFERAGFASAFQIERDAFPRRVLAQRFPGTECYDDVRTVAPDRLPAVDVLHGGFPCQDVSVAGKRAGLAGERSGLFFEFIRVAAALRPRYIVLENVAGLLSSNGGRDMGTVLGTLADIGYGWAYRVLDTQHVGIPQRRRRVFIVGCLGDARAAAEVLFEPEGGAGHPPQGRGQGEGTSYALTSRAPGARLEREASYVVSGTVTGAEAHNGNSNPVPDNYVYRKSHRATSKDDGEIWKPAEVADTINGFDTGDVRATQVVAFAQNQRGEIRDLEGRTGAMQEPGTNQQTILAFAERGRDKGRTLEYSEDLAYALTNPGSGGRTHSRQVMAANVVRRLTPLECERLQSFPDGWSCLCGATEAMLAERGIPEAVWRQTDWRTLRLDGHTQRCKCPDSPRYRLMGNAVTVAVLEAIAQRIALAPQRGEQATARGGRA